MLAVDYGKVLDDYSVLKPSADESTRLVHSSDLTSEVVRPHSYHTAHQWHKPPDGVPRFRRLLPAETDRTA